MIIKTRVTYNTFIKHRKNSHNTNTSIKYRAAYTRYSSTPSSSSRKGREGKGRKKEKEYLNYYRYNSKIKIAYNHIYVFIKHIQI